MGQAGVNDTGVGRAVVARKGGTVGDSVSSIHMLIKWTRPESRTVHRSIAMSGVGANWFHPPEGCYPAIAHSNHLTTPMRSQPQYFLELAKAAHTWPQFSRYVPADGMHPSVVRMHRALNSCSSRPRHLHHPAATELATGLRSVAESREPTGGTFVHPPRLLYPRPSFSFPSRLLSRCSFFSLISVLFSS